MFEMTWTKFAVIVIAYSFWVVYYVKKYVLQHNSLLKDPEGISQFFRRKLKLEKTGEDWNLELQSWVMFAILMAAASKIMLTSQVVYLGIAVLAVHIVIFSAIVGRAAMIPKK